MNHDGQLEDGFGECPPVIRCKRCGKTDIQTGALDGECIVSENNMKEDAGKPVEKLEWRLTRCDGISCGGHEGYCGGKGMWVELHSPSRVLGKMFVKPGLFRSLESMVRKAKDKIMAEYTLVLRESGPAFIPHPAPKQWREG